MANIDAVVNMIQQKRQQQQGGLAQGSPMQQAAGVPAPADNGYGGLLTNLVSAIQGYQQANPVQTPFAAGTKTLAKTQADREYELAKQAAALSAYRARSGGSGGGSGGGGGNLTATERKNQILNSLIPGVMNAKNSGIPIEQVTDELYGGMGELGESVSTKDIEDLVGRLYGDGTSDVFGEPEEEMTPEEIQRQALKQRPWWQKAVDILPGKQFR